MNSLWWVEIIVGVIAATPGVIALLQARKKVNAETGKIDAEREAELIDISRKAAKELIDQLGTRIKNLHDDIVTLEQKCAGYEKRIDELEKEVDAKNKRIDELEKSELQKDKRIKELEEKVYALEHPEEKK